MTTCSAYRRAEIPEVLLNPYGNRLQPPRKVASICSKVHLPSNGRFLSEKRGLQKISVSFHLDGHGSPVLTESLHINRPRTFGDVSTFTVELKQSVNRSERCGPDTAAIRVKVWRTGRSPALAFNAGTALSDSLVSERI